MSNDHAPRMTSDEYFRCLDAAAGARSADDVWRIRGEILHKFRGDARADDLCEALHAHASRLAGEGYIARRVVGERSRSQSGW